MAVHTFEDAFALLRSLTNYERQGTMRYDKSFLDLDRTRRLLEAVGSPERDLPVLHVAGTKGKGTACEIAGSILEAAGRRTGVYTSPHLRHVRERIRVNGLPIPPRAFARLVEEMRPLLLVPRGRPTFFEILTAMALRHFRDARADAAVLEVGLGGTWDATNVVVPRASLVTSISHDHTRYLGRTLRSIAREKAGIAKRGVPLVSGVPDRSSPGREIRRRAEGAGAPLSVLGIDFGLASVETGADGVRFDLEGRGGTWRGLRLPVLGRHQAENAAVVIEALRLAGEADPALRVTETEVRRGLARVRAEGRLQVLGRRPWLVVDGAHNRASVRASVRTVREDLPHERLAVVLGTMRDKDIAGILDEVASTADVLYPVRADLARAVPAEELAERARRHPARPRVVLAGRPLEAIERAREEVGRAGAVLLTGSVVLAGEVLARRDG